tara:strand:- start:375 stop:926 length:552 start_codon:yes stop_codon:yes gene_type:complete
LYKYFFKIYNYFFLPQKIDKKIKIIYDQIISQSRIKEIYSKFGINDTLEGRFDFIILHYSMIMIKINSFGKVGEDVSQKLFDLFMEDIDKNLREIGVSDIKIGKEVKKMSSAVIGRYNAYNTAITSNNNEKLKDALKNNLYRSSEINVKKIDKLIKYIWMQYNHLKVINYNNFFINTKLFINN